MARGAHFDLSRAAATERSSAWDNDAIEDISLFDAAVALVVVALALSFEAFGAAFNRVRKLILHSISIVSR